MCYFLGHFGQGLFGKPPVVLKSEPLRVFLELIFHERSSGFNILQSLLGLKSGTAHYLVPFGDEIHVLDPKRYEISDAVTAIKLVEYRRDTWGGRRSPVPTVIGNEMYEILTHSVIGWSSDIDQISVRGLPHRMMESLDEMAPPPEKSPPVLSRTTPLAHDHIDIAVARTCRGIAYPRDPKDFSAREMFV